MSRVMIILKRRRLWIWIALLTAVTLMMAFSKGVSFSTKRAQADAYFKSQSLEPRYHVYRHGERDMFYAEVGREGLTPVIFVHGSPGSWGTFMRFMGHKGLLGKAKLISVDRPGFGESGRGAAEKSIRMQAAAIQPILARYARQKPAILVGHSFGGPVIARLAMDYPELVGGLILVAPSIDPDLEKTKWYQIPADWKAFSWMLPTDLVTTNREILPLKRELEEMLPLWSAIRVPVTLIQGEKDRLVPPANADFAKKVLLNAPLNVIREPDLNHFIPWNRPDLILDAIFDQLAYVK